MISRRALLATAPALLVSGCGDTQYGNVTRLASILAGRNGIAYDPVKARQLPYATMDAKLGVSQSSLIVLSRYDGDDLWWVTADSIILITRHGRLVATSGFPDDLLQMIFWGADPITAKQPAVGTTQRGLDLAYRNLFGIRIDSTWSELGTEMVDIYGDRRTLRVCREVCKAQDFDWEFENTFWRDDNNFVWKSAQHFSPGVAPLELAVLRPAA